MSINVLFICGRNKRRSPTAERVFTHDARLQGRSAGLGDTSPRRLKEADLRWAHLVLVMERKYKGRIRATFRAVEPLPPIESLDIPDEYIFMQAELVALLKSSVQAALDVFQCQPSPGGADEGPR